MKFTNSRRLYKEACKYMPAGVNSPVRAFKAVGGSPIFYKKAKGAHVFDEDGNRFIDYVMSWGALILGHAHPAVKKAVKEACESGTSFGAPIKEESQLCRIISEAVPSMRKIRLVSSGTEAAMSAIRLIRGFSGRDKIIKFSGCYHGHFDALMVKAGSGMATYSVPSSAGIPKGLAKDTIVCPYNDIDYFKKVVEKKHKDIACVIVEPVAANMGVVSPKPGFLEGLREITGKYRIVLIFDEVITGFRLGFCGAQNIYGIEPDLTCLGKIIGAGLPMAAFGGRKEIMDYLSPLGPVYQAGTLSGNPAAVKAGLAALKALSRMDYSALRVKTETLCRKLRENLDRRGIRAAINQEGSLFTVFFTGQRVTDFKQASSADSGMYAKYFWRMLQNGIAMPPSQFEANFVSFAHTNEYLAATAYGQRMALEKL
ncbi:MAG: glutamate-1-semialdehyde 2,1-aminomutase [Candidatus Omnitrophica bacterium]|nr:glutamate-1-semialdehyde 2,1-aminomutase [Candidatus Omnitrophota bacterium]